MKNNFCIGMVAALLATSCNLSPQGFEIKGKASAELEGKMVYLSEYTGRDSFVRDSARVQEGAFMFRGIQDSISNYKLSFIRDKGQVDLSAVMVLENASYRVSVDSVIRITGSPLNNSLRALLDTNAVLCKKSIVASAELESLKRKGELTPEIESALNAIIEDVYARSQHNEIAFIEQNKNNVAGAYVFASHIHNFDDDTKRQIINSAGPDFLRYQPIELMKQELNKKRAAAVGEMFIDVTLPTPDGESLRLSDVVGKQKITIVHFWASWCAPCRAEMPNIINNYQRFKDKGLEIVGVSFDKQGDRWREYIQDNKLSWLHMSDLGHWHSEAGVLYAVSSIPHVVLINECGEVVSRGLLGNDLTNKLAELLID
ncbi:MAG: thioredoxin-like domain-containing protein [Bacteroidales bacterium]